MTQVLKSKYVKEIESNHSNKNRESNDQMRGTAVKLQLDLNAENNESALMSDTVP